MKTKLMLPLVALLAMPAFAQVPGPGSRPGADANGDGVVTRAEEIAAADRRFAVMDDNHDGIVTPEERRAERERTRAERRARPINENQYKNRAGKRFERLDRNNDGQLTGDERRADHRGPMGRPDMRAPHSEPKPESAAEYRAHALERFDRIDTNHDGRIDQAERDAARDRMGPPPGGATPPPPTN